MTSTHPALAVWFVWPAGGAPRPFTLCTNHSTELQADQDRLNAHPELVEAGLRLVRFHVPSGALVHVSLPSGARCAACHKDPPCETIGEGHSLDPGTPRQRTHPWGA